MTRVEFRFLHFMPSQVSGDRITIGLLHTDGQQVRFAWSTARLPSSLVSHRPAVERALKAINARVRRSSAPSGELLGLAQSQRVAEGLGGALNWAPVRVGQTGAPELHFTELRVLSGLGVQRFRRERVVQQLHNDVAALADELAEEHSKEVVQQGRRVSRGQQHNEYVSPLSWKNGSWHHAIAASLARTTPTAIAEEARRLFGLVGLSFPPEEKAVVVALLPADAVLAALAREQADTLRDMGGSQIDVLLAKPGERKKALRELHDRIEQDVKDAAE